MCVELQSPNEASQGSNEKMVSSMDEALNILEGIALPIPPTVRNSPADRVKTIMEERESVPKYVRLPDIDGIKVIHRLQNDVAALHCIYGSNSTIFLVEFLS